MGWILGILLLAFLGLLWLRRGPSTAVQETGDAAPSPPELPGDIPLDDVLDLHGVPPREVGPLVDAYIEEAHRLGFRRVRLIHGRGIGVLRRTVRVHLERHALVVDFADAPPPSGPGATIATLQPSDHDVATQPDTH